MTFYVQNVDIVPSHIGILYFILPQALVLLYPGSTHLPRYFHSVNAESS